MIKFMHPSRPFRHVFVCLFMLVSGLMLAGQATAQLFPSTSGAPMDPAQAFQLDVSTTEDGQRVLAWTIAEGYYLYRDKIAAETATGDAIPLESDAGIMMDDPTFGPSEIYYDHTEVTLPATDGEVVLTWQGCQEDGICYPPITRTLPATDASLSAPDPSSGEPASDATGGRNTDAAAGTSQAGDMTLADDQGMLASLQARGGTWLVLAGFLGFGLLLAFTPCVFPMFPILAGLLSAEGEGLTARRGAALSGVYVVSMALAFAALGIVAAWSGQNLQMLLQSPAAIYTVAVLFVLLALSMFGLFELQLPAAWTRRLSTAGTQRRGTFGGAATLGFTSALIMGPCVTAPLAGALLYIAGTGDMVLGAAALFALGLGQGIPLLIVGILGSSVLPRAGAWMNAAKQAFGFGFLAMAIWLVGRLVPGPLVLALWAGLLVAIGVFARALDMLPAGAGPALRGLRAVGVSAMIAGLIFAVGAATGGDDPLRPLARLTSGGGAGSSAATPDVVEFHSVTSKPQLDAVLNAAQDRPALVYVTADWCVTCRAIERNVWADGTVRSALSDVSLIAVDVSDFGPESQVLLKQLGAVGPPTMVFLDRDRTEAEGTRIVGNTDPGAVIDALAAVR